MRKKTHFGFLALSVCVVALALSACTGGGRALTAEEILVNAALATLEIDTVQFVIEREGEPPVIDAGTGSKFLSAKGFYQAPDTVQATVNAETPFGVQELGLVISPDGNSMTIPGLGTLELQDEFGFSPVDVFQEEGLPAALQESIVEPVLEGEETIEGVNTYHVTGTVDGESIATLTAGVVTTEDMAIDIYVDTETFQVVRVVLTESSGDRWLVDLFAYGEPAVG
jgi:hypothetical protein